MAIKDQTMTTDRDSQGNDFVSEISSTYTETLADGTEMTAEIMTTADADDPMQIEGHMTVTATAPDGTETVTEIVTNEEGSFIVEDESALEEFVEAALGVEIENILTPLSADGKVSDSAATGVFQSESEEVFQADSDFQPGGTDFTIGEEMFNPSLTPTETGDVFAAETPVSSIYTATDADYSVTPIYDATLGTAETTGDVYTATSDTDAAKLAEQEAHTQAAKEAQESADEFIAAGDYAAAADARETAENEAWEAGDDSMLSAYDAQDLTNAAEKQEDAQFYEAQQAQFAQAGDYEAALDAADKAGYATYEADSSAGGDDHTGQADAEKYNMENAVWQEGIAEDDMENAAYYAEAGNFEAAESSLNSAAEHQESADHYGDLGEHGGDMAVYDYSSEVATGGTYDSTYDTSAVDTGFDSSVDTTTSSSYDSGTDDV